MKKYLMMGAAAMTLALVSTSCSKDKDLYDPMKAGEIIVDNYNQAFIETFGEPAYNQDWGFGIAAGARATRAITVNGDVYNKFPSYNDVADYFPTAIPADADEVSQLEALYVGKEYGEPDEWGNRPKYYSLYDVYRLKIVEGYNLKITSAGTYDVGGCQNSEWDGEKSIYHYYNVYVNVPNGKVIINRPQDSHFNLYILNGDVEMGPTQASEWSSNVISVGAGATFTDGRDHIAANGGVRLFNKGTVYATNTTKYDIGNFCTVYNMGKFEVSGPLTYSPADGNGSFFVNMGDEAELTAPAMTLNSTGNFFNSGTVNIEGETNVTQQQIFWVNAGHYTTGTMTFSAKNNTFFNYCQLIVNGYARMFDGEFNLMESSYTEAGSAGMDNFIVNMGSNTGMHIKGNVRMIAQGDATFQGFRTEGSNDYLLIDGKVTVDAHYHTFSVTPGITYSVNEIEILKGDQVVTDEYLKSINDGAYPVLDLNGTECPYGELTVTPSPTSCGATWNKKNTPQPDPTPNTPKLRVICEDLSASEASDFDFNDIVFDVEYVSDTQVQITVLAAGGTLPLTIAGQEVHGLFGVSTGTIVNTHNQDYYHGAPCATKDPVTFTYNGSFSTDEAAFKLAVKNIPLAVQKNDGTNDRWFPLEAEVGQPACKIGVPTTFQWMSEGRAMTTVEGFSEWVADPTHKVVW